MKKSKFTETQIVKAIQEHQAGRKAEDICREMGINQFETCRIVNPCGPKGPHG